MSDEIAKPQMTDPGNPPEEDKKGWFSERYIFWYIIGLITMKFVFEYMGWFHH